MQQHPGSWFIGPWGIPLQKMMTVPYHPAAAAAVGYHQSPAVATTVPTHPSSHPQQSQSQQQQQQQQQQTHIGHAYQHHPMHQLHHTTAALSAAAALQQGLHPHPAAAAMFTPLTLRTFMSPTPNHMSLNPTQLQQTVQHSPNQQQILPQAQSQLAAMNINVMPLRQKHQNNLNSIGAPVQQGNVIMPVKKILLQNTNNEKEKSPKIHSGVTEKRKAEESEQIKDVKKAKLETKALKAKRPGFTDERYHETSYFIENGLRKVYPYYFTFTTFTKGRWVGEKILDVFAREFRAHPAEEYERCIKAGTLTVNYEKVPTDYRLKHNDLLANIVHRHEVPVTSQPITIVAMDDDIVVVNKPASIPVHPCGRYRHNTVVFILAKEYNLKNLRTIHRLDRLTSGLLLFGRSPKKARQMEHQIRNRQVRKEYVCRVEGEFPEGTIECKEPIEVVSYKIGVCKVSPKGKECTTTFQKLGYNGKTSVVLCKPLTGRMHQIRVHLQYLGYPVVNDPLYNHEVFGPNKGRGGDIGGKTDEQLVRDLINIHNAENWLGIDGDSELSLFKPMKPEGDDNIGCLVNNKAVLSDDDSESVSREASPCSESPCGVSVGSESPQCYGVNAAVGPESPIRSHSVGTSTSTQSFGATTTVSTVTTIANHRSNSKVTVATQTGHESPDLAFNPDKMTSDKHCYECKVRYRDPKPQDLVMYLHAWKYKGPGWEYETELPDWANVNWSDPDNNE